MSVIGIASAIVPRRGQLAECRRTAAIPSPDDRTEDPHARFPPAGTQPGLRHARHGRDLDAGRHADRARHAARRRQRARRGGGRLRRAVRDRAAIDRHRRRLLLPLRPGRRRQGHRAQRLRPRAGRRHDRLVRAARRPARWTIPRRTRVTIPGAVGAWETLLDAHGRKGLDELLQPAIRFAEDGWPVHPQVAWDWTRQATKLRSNGAHALPARRHGAARGRHVRPAGAGRDAARDRRAAARSAFYEGPVAADMVATLRARGGVQTEEDFADGRDDAEFVEPIRLNWRGHDVWQCPPNGPGLVALMILGMLGGFGPAADGPLGATRCHRHIEAARLAYRDRDAFIADPAAGECRCSKLLEPGVPRRRCAR